MKLTNPSELKRLLEPYGFSFSKSLGQNFLIDENVLDSICESANLTENSGVIEIGPGAGTLTRELCKNAKKVVAIEIDKALLPVLKESLAEFDNVEVINSDILKTDLQSIINDKLSGLDIAVAANLPYYITTPIIMKIFEERIPVRSMTVMVQKEVADRMTAKPGTKDYGALSVAVQYYSKPKIVCSALPHCFMPQPKVASIVVNMDIPNEPTVKVKNEKLFFAVVKSAFGQRRKTLVNSVANSPYINISKQDITKVISDMGLDINIRGERLSLEQFGELSDRLCEI